MVPSLNGEMQKFQQRNCRCSFSSDTDSSTVPTQMSESNSNKYPRSNYYEQERTATEEVACESYLTCPDLDFWFSIVHRHLKVIYRRILSYI